ncbi:Fc receptor-like B [Pteropus alecto]|uniref:Fc receptor-like B n=1 Tax=Pteropus alecto TaxID=9402 RepID=L5KY15_PTEAL|nr:Fc receptor-like B [Pteropus alecto]
MWALTTLLLLAALEKPTLSLHPPWTTIFKGERVTLRCDGDRPLVLELRPVSTLWYLGHLLLPSHRASIEVQAPGAYRCQTRGAPVSDPVHLSVSTDWLILQVPFAAVFEGEPLVLRCRGWYDKAVYKLHYYRDGRAVRFFASSANYTVPQARAGDSGRYQCSGTMRIPVESAPMFSAKVAVTVQAPGATRDAPTAAAHPQAAAWAPGNKPPSSRKPLGSASGPEATSIPDATSAGPQVPAGRAAPVCAPLEPLEQPAGAPGPDVDQLLREMRLLRGLLSRAVLELQGAQASPGRRATPELPAPRSAGTPGTPGTPETSPAQS